MNTNILELNNDNFDVEMSAGLCFVDFWAVWCGPCKMLAPVVEELAVECVGKMKFGKVNVDIEESLSAKYMVMNIPTMVILENGVEVERIVGFRPKAQILEIINKHLTK